MHRLVCLGSQREIPGINCVSAHIVVISVLPPRVVFLLAPKQLCKGWRQRSRCRKSHRCRLFENSSQTNNPSKVAWLRLQVPPTLAPLPLVLNSLGLIHLTAV